MINFEISLKSGIDPFGVPRITYYHFNLNVQVVT